MNMIEIWKKRVRLHQKKMMRYMKYVFNDHFVLVCLFLIGALGYAYSNFLKLSRRFYLGSAHCVSYFCFIDSNWKISNLDSTSRCCILTTKRRADEGLFQRSKNV